MGRPMSTGADSRERGAALKRSHIPQLCMHPDSGERGAVTYHVSQNDDCMVITRCPDMHVYYLVSYLLSRWHGNPLLYIHTGPQLSHTLQVDTGATLPVAMDATHLKYKP